MPTVALPARGTVGIVSPVGPSPGGRTVGAMVNHDRRGRPRSVLRSGPGALARLVVVVAVLVGGTACEVVSGRDATPTASPTTGAVVRIGVGPEQESVLVGAVLGELARGAGFTPEVVGLADGEAVRQALEVGDVDVAPGYTGQVWLEQLGRENPPGDPRSSFQGVASADESNGITWLRPGFDLEAGLSGPPANATLALWALPEVAAEAPSIAELGALVAERDSVEVCVDAGFGRRADGWAAVAQRYSIGPVTLVEATPREAVAGVASGQCVVGLSTLTDGAAWAEELVPLADPLAVFPAFVVSVQLRNQVVDELPDLGPALQPLPDHLTTAQLGTWNAGVGSGEEVATVAVAAAEQLRAA